jgi:TPP-dependent pyruvate/acetoin dehydrogenase alpha subunit
MTLAEAEVALAALNPRPFPLPLGRLAPVVEGGFAGVSRRSWVVAGPRERIGAVLRGCPVERLVDPAAGARPYKLAPVSDAPGNRALHAVGLALGTGEPVLCFLGLASAASGALHEALNAAALTGAPVIFLLTVTPIPDDAPISGQLAASPAALAAAHGLATARVAATVEAVREAVSAAADAGAPTLIEAILE